MKTFVAHAANYLMTALFALSAVVQYNDPDPLPWMLMYGLVAGSCILFATGRLHPRLSLVIAGIALVWALWLVPFAVGSSEELTWGNVFDVSEMINERVEVVREIGGLLISAAWMIFLSVLARQPRAQEEEFEG